MTSRYQENRLSKINLNKSSGETGWTLADCISFWRSSTSATRRHKGDRGSRGLFTKMVTVCALMMQRVDAQFAQFEISSSSDICDVTLGNIGTSNPLDDDDEDTNMVVAGTTKDKEMVVPSDIGCYDVGQGFIWFYYKITTGVPQVTWKKYIQTDKKITNFIAAIYKFDTTSMTMVTGWQMSATQNYLMVQQWDEAQIPMPRLEHVYQMGNIGITPFEGRWQQYPIMFYSEKGFFRYMYLKDNDIIRGTDSGVDATNFKVDAWRAEGYGVKGQTIIPTAASQTGNFFAFTLSPNRESGIIRVQNPQTEKSAQLPALITDCGTLATNCQFVEFTSIVNQKDILYGAGTCIEENCVAIFQANGDMTNFISCNAVPVLYIWPQENIGLQKFRVFDIHETVTGILSILMRPDVANGALQTRTYRAIVILNFLEVECSASKTIESNWNPIQYVSMKKEETYDLAEGTWEGLVQNIKVGKQSLVFIMAVTTTGFTQNTPSSKTRIVFTHQETQAYQTLNMISTTNQNLGDMSLSTRQPTLLQIQEPKIQTTSLTQWFSASDGEITSPTRITGVDVIISKYPLRQTAVKPEIVFGRLVNPGTITVEKSQWYDQFIDSTKLATVICNDAKFTNSNVNEVSFFNTNLIFNTTSPLMKEVKLTTTSTITNLEHVECQKLGQMEIKFTFIVCDRINVESSHTFLTKRKEGGSLETIDMMMFLKIEQSELSEFCMKDTEYSLFKDQKLQTPSTSLFVTTSLDKKLVQFDPTINRSEEIYVQFKSVLGQIDATKATFTVCSENSIVAGKEKILSYKRAAGVQEESLIDAFQLTDCPVCSQALSVSLVNLDGDPLSSNEPISINQTKKVIMVETGSPFQLDFGLKAEFITSPCSLVIKPLILKNSVQVTCGHETFTQTENVKEQPDLDFKKTVVIPLETITSWFSLSDPYCHLSEIFISKDNLGTNYEQIDEIWNFVEVSRSSNFTLTFKNNGSTLTSDKLISVLMEAVTIGNQRSFIEVKITLKALLNKAPYFIENLEKLVIEVKEEEQIAGLAQPIFTWKSPVATDSEKDNITMIFKKIQTPCNCITIAHSVADNTLEVTVDKTKVTKGDSKNNVIQLKLRDQFYETTKNETLAWLRVEIKYTEMEIIVQASQSEIVVVLVEAQETSTTEDATISASSSSQSVSTQAVAEAAIQEVEDQVQEQTAIILEEIVSTKDEIVEAKSQPGQKTVNFEAWEKLVKKYGHKEKVKSEENKTVKVNKRPILFFKSFSSTGLLEIVFNQELVVPDFITQGKKTEAGRKLVSLDEINMQRDVIKLIYVSKDATDQKSTGFYHTLKEWTSKKIQIQVEFDNPLDIGIGSSKDEMIIQVVNPALFFSKESRAQISSDDLVYHTLIPTQLPPGANAENLIDTSKQTEKAVTAIAISQIIFQFIMKGSMERMWIVFLCLQLFIYTTYFDVSFPANYIVFQNSLKNLIEFSFLKPEPFIQFFDQEFTIQEFIGSKSEDLAEMLKELQMIILIVFVFVAVLAFLGSLMLIKKIRTKVVDLLLKIKNNTLYTGLVRTFQLSFLKVGVVFGVIIVDIIKENPVTQIMKIQAITQMSILGIVALVTTFFACLKSKTMQEVSQTPIEDKTESQKKFTQAFKIFYYDVKTKHTPKNVLYLGSFFIRRLLYLAIPIIFVQQVTLQLISLTLMNVFHIILVTSKKPFLTSFRNRIELFNEFVFIIFCDLMFMFTNYDIPQEVKYNLGYVAIGIIVLLLFVNIMNITIMLIQDRLSKKADEAYKKVWESYFKKKREQMENELEMQQFYNQFKPKVVEESSEEDSSSEEDFSSEEKDEEIADDQLKSLAKQKCPVIPFGPEALDLSLAFQGSTRIKAKVKTSLFARNEVSVPDEESKTDSQQATPKSQKSSPIGKLSGHKYNREPSMLQQIRQGISGPLKQIINETEREHILSPRTEIENPLNPNSSNNKLVERQVELSASKDKDQMPLVNQKTKKKGGLQWSQGV